MRRLNKRTHHPSNIQQQMCFVERFIILFLPANQEGSHDGDASNEELCEHILYYNELGEGRSYPYNSRCWYNCEAAAKFSGLCTALYSIQSTVDSQLLSNENEESTMSDNKSTQEVYLSTCTLVFIPLEKLHHGEILAVAKLERKSATAGKCKSGLSPQRLRQSALKAHELFVLMNRGGIHQSFTCHKKMENDSKVESGTSNLRANQKRIGTLDVYDLQKELEDTRIQSEKVQDDKDQKNILENDIRELETMLDDIEPLRELRTDLKYYYDSFLRDIAASE